MRRIQSISTACSFYSTGGQPFMADATGAAPLGSPRQGDVIAELLCIYNWRSQGELNPYDKVDNLAS